MGRQARDRMKKKEVERKGVKTIKMCQVHAPNLHKKYNHQVQQTYTTNKEKERNILS